MEMKEAEKLFRKGLDALAQGDTVSALAAFEKTTRIDDNPVYASYLAFCVAKERGQFQLAVTICEKSIAREPKNAVHYLNLGKIYLLGNKKADAIRTFRDGLQYGENQEIIDELARHGTRKPPVFPFLSRGNFLNKYTGIILKKLGLR
ncbi:MAG TPA: tetratricopeptide repeat protein [Thermodesulfovibrionales bacterium]|nr:tetratricopeptide repeat protein [Thermodesulfovibrionales bacterium]